MLKTPGESLYLRGQRDSKLSYPHLHICSAVPCCGCTHTLFLQCTCIVHPPLNLCVVHLTYASVICLSLPLRCLISSYCLKALPQCALGYGSSLINVWENVSVSSTTSLSAESGIVLHVFLHRQFILDCFWPVIQFLHYVFVTHRG